MFIVMASTSNFQIPVVDFSNFALNLEEENIARADLVELADEICDAFKNIGFVYLKNYGIPQQKINEMQDLATSFFTLPAHVKEQYARSTTNNGWVALEREGLNEKRPGDLKEAYNVTPSVAEKWPDHVVPGFQTAVMDTFNKCTVLSNRLHFLMGLGLKLKTPNLFRESHNPLQNPCSTTFRMLYYPPLPDCTVKPNQIRCGEHTDYGSITLLFQDQIGGLEVMNRSGEFVPAVPIADTVLVNVADLMQRWTSDQLVSTKHRVVRPTAEIGCTKPRISLAFFVHPDNDYLIECIDGTNKYEPITSYDYLQRRLKATYAY